jgi:hypothetical protein
VIQIHHCGSTAHGGATPGVKNAALPGNPALRSAWRTFAVPNTITTQPLGAKVFWREYNAPNAAWEYLGRTPLSLLFPASTFRLRFELEGYRSYEAAPFVAFVADPFPLDRVGAIPDELVHVAGGHFGPGPGGQELGGYLLDQYEVTNRRYKHSSMQAATAAHAAPALREGRSRAG